MDKKDYRDCFGNCTCPVAEEPTCLNFEYHSSGMCRFRTWADVCTAPRKKPAVAVSGVAVALAILLFAFPVCADVAVSLSGYIGYDKMTVSSGYNIQRDGDVSEESMPLSAALQVSFGNWAWRPTIELSYKTAKYDLSSKTQYLVSWPREYSIRAGVTRTWKYFSAYGLLGYTIYEPAAKMIEVRDGKTMPHSINPHDYIPDVDSKLFSVKLGVFKVFRVGPVSIGPEAALEIYPFEAPGVDRCRTAHSNQFAPHVGVRIQY